MNLFVTCFCGNISFYRMCYASNLHRPPIKRKTQEDSEDEKKGRKKASSHEPTHTVSSAHLKKSHDNNSNKQQQSANPLTKVDKKEGPSGNSPSTYNTSVLSKPSIHKNRTTTNTTTNTSNTQHGNSVIPTRAVNPAIPTRASNSKTSCLPKGNDKECVGEYFFGPGFEIEQKTMSLMDRIDKQKDASRKKLEALDEKQRNINAANKVSFVQPLKTCDSSLFKRRKNKTKE